MSDATIYNFLSYQTLKPLKINFNDEFDILSKKIHESSIESLWHSYLHYRFELTKKYELTYLFNNFYWKNSDHILEIGYGPGFPIGNRKRFFPEKKYDLLSFQIEPDARKCKKNLQFIADETSENDKKKYDIILLRDLSSHKTDSFYNFLKSLSTQLKPNGKVIHIELNDFPQTFGTELTELKKIFEKVMRSSSDKRDFCSKPILFSMNQEKRQISLFGESDRKLIFQSYLFLAEYVQKKHGINYCHESLYKELKKWFDSSFSLMQMELFFSIHGTGGGFQL